MTKEEKSLLKTCIESVFHGKTIRQDLPTCECGKIFSEKQICEAPGVYFRDVQVFGKTFTLVEPTCPVCKKKVPASFYILN